MLKFILIIYLYGSTPLAKSAVIILCAYICPGPHTAVDRSKMQYTSSMYILQSIYHPTHALCDTRFV
jgi:hypothetical protein